MSKSEAEACRDEIIRQIERSLRKGHVEGMVVNSCVACDSGIRITLPAARVTILSSSVQWKSYGGVSGEKIRK